MFVDFRAVWQAANDATIVLVYELHTARSRPAPTKPPSCLPFRRIIRLMLRIPSWRRGACHECRTLRQNALKRLLIIPAHLLGQLDSCKCPGQVGTGDEIAVGWLWEDLRLSGEGQVEFGRELKVEVEVLGGLIGGDHEEAHGLRAGRGEGGFVAILDVVGMDMVEGEEEPRVF